MQIFLAVLILVALALLATDRRFYRLRRSKMASALLTGGWIAVAAGFLLGEFGLGVISPDLLRETTPLLIVGLGWIGMMVGLQLKREVITAIPAAVRKLTLVDAALSLVVVGPAAALGVTMWTTAVRSGAEHGAELAKANAWPALFPAAVLLSAGAIGWSMETRSQRVTGKTELGDKLALVVRYGGALSAVVAIAAYGIADKFVVRVEQEARFDVGFALAAAGLTVLLAVIAAIIGRFALSLAGSDRGQQLAVFLALVTFVAGIAAQTDLSPLFAAMLTGVVLTNLPSEHLDRFQRFILRAEHAVAVFFALLAGLLINPLLHPYAVLLAVAIAVFRWLGKPAAAKLGLRRERLGEPPELPPKSTLYVAAARQSPIAMAMAVALVADEWSEFHRQMLAVVLLIGLLSEIFPLIGSVGRRQAVSSGAVESPAGTVAADAARGRPEPQPRAGGAS